MTDADRIKLVATVMIRRIAFHCHTGPPAYQGDPTLPVTKADDEVFAQLKKQCPDLHNEIFEDAAAICAALERAEQ